MKIYLKEVMKELNNLKLKNTEELKIKYIKILKNMGVLNIRRNVFQIKCCIYNK